MLSVLVQKKSDNAVIPKKGNDFAAGYDLTCIEKISEEDDIIIYDTGIAIQTPESYHMEVVPRSSFAKSGYIFLNSLGIIDEDYRGSIKIMVMKINPKKTDLEVPFTKFQLILRKTEKAEIKEVKELTETKRGSGGFGSTDPQIWKNDKGEIHNDNDLPAIVWPDGKKEWWINGKKDRRVQDEYGYLPAEIWPDGTKFWYFNGLLHKPNGPAVVRPDGTVEYWINGEKRDDISN